MEAICECIGQLWVPGWPYMHEHLRLSFCPLTLQRVNLWLWWICRWMPIWKRSRLVPFLSG